jgi:diguanylate cyclase (GGDEF)-like protein/putative nucleotidyltransferase with HDIG domain
VSTVSAGFDWRRALDPNVEAQAGEAIARCERLPVLEPRMRRVLELTADEESLTSDLVVVLEGDPALAANILRYANSAYVGRPFRARTLRQAVTMVGRRSTRQLCLETVTFRFFQSALGVGRASLGQLHIHAVQVARIAAETATLIGIPNDLPHLAGLLHDCGKLVMPVAFGEPAMQELVSAYPSGVARSEAEWEQFGLDHAYAGALLAEASGLDDEIVAAIAWHHGGRRGCVTPSKQIACVQIADNVASMLTGSDPDQTLLDSALRYLELDSDVLDQLAESATTVEPPPPSNGLRDRVAELEMLASTDELTGVANRRHWMSCVRTSMRAGEAGTVLLCDLDHFKQINDTHGHRSGDLVLMEIARILARHGLAGRIGGDEFAVWVPGNHDADDAAEQIVGEVTNAFDSSFEVTVGISVGIAPPNIELSSAIELADRALYAAKAGGRHRASRATEPHAA